jgi:hypothetical protein
MGFSIAWKWLYSLAALTVVRGHRLLITSSWPSSEQNKNDHHFVRWGAEKKAWPRMNMGFNLVNAPGPFVMQSPSQGGTHAPGRTLRGIVPRLSEDRYRSQRAF